jgi:hypothetical protein
VVPGGGQRLQVPHREDALGQEVVLAHRLLLAGLVVLLLVRLRQLGLRHVREAEEPHEPLPPSCCPPVVQALPGLRGLPTVPAQLQLDVDEAVLAGEQAGEAEGVLLAALRPRAVLHVAGE